MTMADLANYKGEWVEPVTSDYHGYTLAELPPPSQGFAANEMLNILAACSARFIRGRPWLRWARPIRATGTCWSRPRSWPMRTSIAINGDPDFNPGMAATR